MSLRRMWHSGVAVVFAAVCLGLSTPWAFADGALVIKDCDQQVLDLTTNHVLQGNSTIDPAVKDLDSRGVDVRVRIFDVPPGGSLDAYEAAQIGLCPSWGADGHIRPNLLVVLMTLEHHDAIFYGKNFASTMQSEVDSVRGAMRDPYEQSHYAEAITTGLHDSSEVIKGNQNPATMTGGLSNQMWLVIGIVGIVLGAVGWSIYKGRRGGSYGGGGGFSSFTSSDSSGGGGGGSGDGGSSGAC